MRSAYWLSTAATLSLACTPPAAPNVSSAVIVLQRPPERQYQIAAPSPVEHRVTRDAFVDPLPPRGWTQCAGFVNTEGDDVDTHFLDGCLETNRLRVRVFTARDVLEEDVFVTGMQPEPAWRDNYLAGESTIVKNTFWGTTEGGAPSLFLVHTDGKDACLQIAGPPDTMTFGSGHAEKAIIVPGATGYDEYRISCGRESLPDRKIAIYR